MRDQPYTLTAGDYDLCIRLGLLDMHDRVEIVRAYADVYGSKLLKALGIRAGQRTPSVR